MNLSKRISLLALALASVLAYSCKDDDAEDPNAAPLITILSPTDAELAAGYTRGSSILLSGTVTDDEQVSSIKLEVFQGSTRLFEEDQTDIDQQEVEFSQTVNIPGLAPTGSYRVVLTATDNKGKSSNVAKNFEIR